MSWFDTIIEETNERFGLNSEGAGSLLSALLNYISDPGHGGFGGFVDRFRTAGLGDVVNSWITTGDNTTLSNEQLESAIGEDGIRQIADRAGLEQASATPAIAAMIPHVVDQLTPDGEMPDETSVLTRITGLMPGASAAASSGAFTGEVVDRVDPAAEFVQAKGRSVDEMGDRITAERSGGAGGALRWLIPLILLGILIALGMWFCGPSTPVGPANVDVNANTVNINATPRNTAPAAAVPANSSPAARTMTEVSLPNGTKLQAYPGGIEDQIVKYVGSPDFKNATNDQLKDRWFNFDDLNFKFGTTELAPESKRQLDNIVTILKAYPELKIKIGGYTDKKGDDASNLKLSDGRAKAVQAALQKAGVGSQVPEAEGYGEQFATVAETASDEERAVDRKTAIRLIR